ncbi:acetyltransferase [Colletotrichum navitas]|uniref:Acetyltransferase n=1 Tax=Colletotrichum navitas TaxID=681940 RepID=A0AAD8UXM6_9PEZI|nr:acetyltransferase [Colletotrichum navitas]KAK1572847.1 acetyltransferase [Colletotrichum navitas]
MATENKYIIQQCTVADSDELTRNNISAFWADPHWNLAWPVDPATGRIVGFARWYLPASHSTTADGTPTWPDAMVPAVTPEEEAEIQRNAKTAHWDPNEESDELLIPIREAKDEILAKKSYMRLDYLAVHPDNQGKGIGTVLVESGMKQAEEMKLDIFVHAMKAGVGVYKRLGFSIEKEFSQDDTEYGGEGEVDTALMIYRQKV